jgi:hypothetical protein
MKILNGFELRITTTSASGDIDFFASCVDHTLSGATFPQNLGNVVGATDAALVTSPLINVTRTVNQLFISNKNAANNTITVYINDGTNDYIVAPQLTLAYKEYLIYNKEDGWKVFGRNGILKTGSGLTPITGTKIVAHKVGSAAEGAGVLQFFGTFAGAYPGAWAVGTSGLSGRAVVGTEAGAIQLPPALSGNLFLTEIGAFATAACTVQLVDVLWVNNAINVTTLTAQTINSVALPPRDNFGTSDGVGVLIGLLVTTATTNAAAIANTTISYTNSDGVAGRTATLLTPNTIPATAAVGSLILFHLQAGDKGVRSIQSITLNTSLAGGAVSLMMLRVLDVAPCPSPNIGTVNKPVSSPGILLYPDSFISFLQVPTATTANVIQVSLSVMELA